MVFTAQLSQKLFTDTLNLGAKQGKQYLQWDGESSVRNCSDRVIVKMRIHQRSGSCHYRDSRQGRTSIAGLWSRCVLPKLFHQCH